VLAFGLGKHSRDTVNGMYLGPGEQLVGDTNVLGARFTLNAARDKAVQRAWIPLLGRHNVSNALAAAAVGQALGISPLRVRRGLAEAQISGMRMTVYRLNDGTLLIDDAYNASSPEAMEGALDVLKETDGFRRLAVLGSMLELGPASDAAHKRVGEYVARVKPDVLVTVGEGGSQIAAAAVKSGLKSEIVTECADNDGVIAALAEQRRPGDVILVKGSRGMAMEHVVRALRGVEQPESKAA
jgi:UDP-N-acetylmuramoyl-tripeptide--D-alanyl-D-alanine ligase